MCDMRNRFATPRARDRVARVYAPATEAPQAAGVGWRARGKRTVGVCQRGSVRVWAAVCGRLGVPDPPNPFPNP